MNVNVHGQHLAVERIHENALSNFRSNTGQRGQKGFRLAICHLRERCERWRAESPSEFGDNGDYLACFELAEPPGNEESFKPGSIFGKQLVPTWESLLKRTKHVRKTRITGSRREDDVKQVV